MGEFLAATPRNSSEALDGQGIYMKSRGTAGERESVAFFVGEDTFVYVFGASIAAPTEAVAKSILDEYG